MTYEDISPAVAAYSMVKMLKRASPTLTLSKFGMMAPRLTVEPLAIACRYCGAEANEKCTRWRRKHKGKVRAPRTPHPDRVYDAKAATDMARVLMEDE